jgi:hypothetical protein
LEGKKNIAKNFANVICLEKTRFVLPFLNGSGTTQVAEIHKLSAEVKF